ncbi:SDR family oxidoreductase [Nocardia sp. NEAU-G5]|uniref:SDR family oxidoreductase n=1 Tax=Nocardia albiluteola TaxID=2842303 RepID=A0ABS6AVR4_9NOCA|nr:SDR family oxidoreductase [Nocardia albiluteola]MBU3062124.1 SDR family oxidoreductase [Nocardia albiluteola]
MSPADRPGTTAVVTGAGRGFGAGIAAALIGQGHRVVGVARTADDLADVQRELGSEFVPIVADATVAETAASLIEEYQPTLLVLNAGASPGIGPVHEQTWESFSRNWQVDTQHAFHWIGAALRHPLPPGSLVVAISSGAAVGGSPLSGGYSGAKAMIRFLAGYAAEESRRAGLGIGFATVLPQLTPATALGAAGVAAYADRQGVDTVTFAAAFEPLLTPDLVGSEIARLCQDTDTPDEHRVYQLNGRGLHALA